MNNAQTYLDLISIRNSHISNNQSFFSQNYLMKILRIKPNDIRVYKIQKILKSI
jgi:hypothetical protein